MSVELDVDGLVRSLTELGAHLDRETSKAMTAAGAIAAADARTRAPKGPTSQLANSIEGERATGSFTNGDLRGGFVAAAPHALYVEEPTRAHEIKPRHRRFLRIPQAGGFMFRRRVWHPGTAAQPFMGPAIDATAFDVDAEFQAAIDIAIHKAGF